MQLRLAARNQIVDAFVWRNGGSISVERHALDALSIRVPEKVQGDLIALAAIPGLSFFEDRAADALNLICTARCFATQYLPVDQSARADSPARPIGGYVNYDLDAQWLEGRSGAVGGVAEGVLFGPFGLVENSGLFSSFGQTRAARLETRWTIDDVRHRRRLRLGDSTTFDVSGTQFRFGGVAFGTDFALTPSMITYPTPTLAGAAQASSTVELYVNGALSAREQVEAGPFALDHAPLVVGAGVAQIVVTDVLGRQQIISRPFFIGTSLLRRGLSDWSVAAGALRREYGVESDSYGKPFAHAAYRRGIADALTIDAEADGSDKAMAGRMGAAISAPGFGQLVIAHARSHGAANTASFSYDSDRWSFGLQVERRDRSFRSVGDDANAADHLLSSEAFNLGRDLRALGGISVTAARVRTVEEPITTTIALAYTPTIADGALSIRALYSERERRSFSIGLSYNIRLGRNSSASLDGQRTDRADYATASIQSAPPPDGGFGWRALASTGVQNRVQLTGLYRGRDGDTAMEISHFGDETGVRANRTGSIGWVDGDAFAASTIDGGFAIVDVGAPDVEVSRDHLPVGRTNARGLAMVPRLRPYDDNLISIDADDLPLDRAPSVTQAHVSTRASAGVVVRLAPPPRVIDTHTHFATGAALPRGSTLIRSRDGARFPVGSDGRVALLGARTGDAVRLEGMTDCTGAADPVTAAQDIVLTCATQS